MVLITAALAATRSVHNCRSMRLGMATSIRDASSSWILWAQKPGVRPPWENLNPAVGCGLTLEIVA